MADGNELFPEHPDDLPRHDPRPRLQGGDPWDEVPATPDEERTALLARLARGTERALGAVVALFDQRGRFDIGDVLEESRLAFQWAKWGEDLNFSRWALVEIVVEVPAWGYDTPGLRQSPEIGV